MRLGILVSVASFCIVALTLAAHPQALGSDTAGAVHDSAGAAVAGARVEFSSGAYPATTAPENLFNQHYFTTINQVPALGPPLLARVGLRYDFPNR